MVASVSSLFPSNATPLETNLETVFSRDLPSTIGQFWNPYTCPVHLLDYLAWGLSVVEWDSSWPEVVKRDVCNASIALHQVKGTLYAAKFALQTVGFGDAQIIEGRSGYLRDGSMTRDGFLLRGQTEGWAEYKVIIPRLLSIKQAETTKRLLKKLTPARSHLWGLDFSGAVPLHNGVIYRDGQYTRGLA